MQDDNWDDLRFALALSREGSLIAAAERLRVNESTVARRIARLERRFGHTLFDRKDGRLVATPAAQRVLSHAERAEAAHLSAAEEMGQGHSQVAGPVRLTSVPFIINHLLAPHVPKLLERHAGIELELLSEGGTLSLADRQADLSLRFARPTGEGRMLTRKLAQVPYALYRHPEATASSPYILYSESMAHLPQAKWLEEHAGSEDLPNLRVNDLETVLRLLRAGYGRSLLPVSLAEEEGGLLRIGDHDRAVEREIWLVVHPDRRDLARIRAVLDWVEACLSRPVG